MKNEFCEFTSEKVKIDEQILVSQKNSQETQSATLKVKYRYQRFPKKERIYEPHTLWEIVLAIFDLVKILLQLKGNSST